MRVVITRPRGQAEPFAALLREQGAEPVFFPTIEIAPARDPWPLDRALRGLASFDWVIFTSSNAVEAVWNRLDLSASAFPEGPKLAAIGPKTARSLAGRGHAPDFVPQEYISDAILPGLGELAGKRVFLPLADLAEGSLPEKIEAAGGRPVAVIAYHTLPAAPDPGGLAALRIGVDAVCFTSGSTARNFAYLAEKAELDPFRLPGQPLVACIGPKTAAAAEEIGFQVGLVAKTYTVDGLVAALMEYANVASN